MLLYWNICVFTKWWIITLCGEGLDYYDNPGTISSRNISSKKTICNTQHFFWYKIHKCNDGKWPSVCHTFICSVKRGPISCMCIDLSINGPVRHDTTQHTRHTSNTIATEGQDRRRVVSCFSPRTRGSNRSKGRSDSYQSQSINTISLGKIDLANHRMPSTIPSISLAFYHSRHISLCTGCPDI